MYLSILGLSIRQGTFLRTQAIFCLVIRLIFNRMRYNSASRVIVLVNLIS